MRIDFYTKAVLTVIAVLLGVIALRPYASPDAVSAQDAGIQSCGGTCFLDTKTGEYYSYYNGKLTKLK